SSATQDTGGNPTDASSDDGTSGSGATSGPASEADGSGTDGSGTGGSQSQPVTDAPTADVSSGETSDSDGPAVTVLLAGGDVDRNGPLATTVEDLSFSGGGHILVRPTTLTNEPNTKHPVAIWGPGGGTP